MMRKHFSACILMCVLIMGCSSNDDPSPVPNSPVILEMSPTEGLPGVTVNIEGVHFTSALSDLVVKINDTECEVTRADTASVEFVVPEGATTGPITVKVKNQTTSSSEAFTVLESIWKRRADFGGGTRIVGVGFSIGEKGYAGTGVGDVTSMQKDFWAYDPSTDKWTQVADYAGSGTQQAIGFSIGDKGYLGLGTVGGSSTSEFYEYDPATDTWTEKASFAGYGRSGAASFVIGNKGYVSTGASPYEKFGDLWEYDPSGDVWTKKADYPGGPKYHAIGLSIGDKGFVGGGTNDNGTSTKDFWQYDPSTDSWTQKADIPDAIIGYSITAENRTSAVAFSIGSKGYLCTGLASSYRMKDLWEYDPATDEWTKLEDFPGGSRADAFGFVIGDKGYVGCGRGSETVTDFWELSF